MDAQKIGRALRGLMQSRWKGYIDTDGGMGKDLSAVRRSPPFDVMLKNLVFKSSKAINTNGLQIKTAD